MAQLDMAVDHGQSLEVARQNFERAMTAAQKTYGSWVRRLEWSPDRTSVKMVGPGFDLEISYDEKKVYARGTIPFAFKLFERPLKAFLAKALTAQ
jgi:hypothetical protein